MSQDIFDGGALVFHDYPAERYFADDPLPVDLAPALSASMAIDFYEHSPARAYWRANQGIGQGYSEIMTFGTVAHSVILRQQGWDDGIQVLERDKGDFRSANNRAWREAHLAQGNNPIKEEEWEKILDMRKAWISRDLMSLLTCSGGAEVSIFWRCPETYCICKVRWDFLPFKEYLAAQYPAIDYKTTGELVGWQMNALIHHNLMLRAALYYESLLAITPGGANMCYAVQEKEPPYTVQVHHLGLHPEAQNPEHMEFINAGREQLRQVKLKFRECQQSQKWPQRKELVSFKLPAGIFKRKRDEPMAEQSNVEFY